MANSYASDGEMWEAPDNVCPVCKQGGFKLALLLAHFLTEHDYEARQFGYACERVTRLKQELRQDFGDLVKIWGG